MSILSLLTIPQLPVSLQKLCKSLIPRAVTSFISIQFFAQSVQMSRSRQKMTLTFFCLDLEEYQDGRPFLALMSFYAKKLMNNFFRKMNVEKTTLKVFPVRYCCL